MNARKDEIENLVVVKTALAQKHERLARTRHSNPWKARLFRRANTYRRQAANLAERLKQ